MFCADAVDPISIFVCVLFIAMPLQLYLSMKIMVNNQGSYILEGDITANFLDFRMKKFNLSRKKKKKKYILLIIHSRHKCIKLRQVQRYIIPLQKHLKGLKGKIKWKEYFYEHVRYSFLSLMLHHSDNRCGLSPRKAQFSRDLLQTFGTRNFSHLSCFIAAS